MPFNSVHCKVLHMLRCEGEPERGKAATHRKNTISRAATLPRLCALLPRSKPSSVVPQPSTSVISSFPFFLWQLKEQAGEIKQKGRKKLNGKARLRFNEVCKSYENKTKTSTPTQPSDRGTRQYIELTDFVKVTAYHTTVWWLFFLFKSLGSSAVKKEHHLNTAAHTCCFSQYGTSSQASCCLKAHQHKREKKKKV